MAPTSTLFPVPAPSTSSRRPTPVLYASAPTPGEFPMRSARTESAVVARSWPTSGNAVLDEHPGRAQAHTSARAATPADGAERAWGDWDSIGAS